MEASEILFGKGTSETLSKLPESVLLSVFDGVPQSQIKAEILNEDISIVDFISEHTKALSSKSEARRMLKGNAISINKNKVGEDFVVNKESLINNKYIVVQSGRKNYHLVIVD